MKVDNPLMFISYSSFDIEAKEFVRRQLGVLRQVGDIELWHDGEIGVGDDWFQVIETNLQRCDVAILLISGDFLGSEFCIKKEVPVLLERRKREGMMIAPILLRPCAWQIVPWLAAIQMQPSKGKPLLALGEIEQAEELTSVVLAIHSFLEKRAKQGVVTEAKPNTPYPALPDNAIDLTRLPTSGFDVVGRDQELQFLNQAFDGTELNVVSLRAWGGVGKSTLVNKWCEYLAADNYRGARRTFAWSFYSQGTNERVTSADAFIDEALRFFDDHDPTAGSPWAKGERLAELVGKEKALLILDGMEPLQDQHQGIKDPALARLVECLAENNAGLCVITTREPVKEFSDFPETTQEIDLEHLSTEAGRAVLRIKGLRATDDLLEQISEAFGNHALALNLLASFLRLTRFSVQDALKIPDLPDVTVDAGKHPRRVMAAFADHFGEGPELELLHVMGLFDRPADAGCIAALRGSAIPGLTEKLSTLDEKSWQNLLSKLRRLGLLAGASHHAPDDLDAHPLVREHFGARLRDQREDAWKAGHKRLYEYLKTVPKKRQPDTLAEMMPLFQAVHHGCQAGLYCDAFFDEYWERINRDDHRYLTNILGLHSAEISLLSPYFDPAWEDAQTGLEKSYQIRSLYRVAFSLRALGKLNEAARPMQIALKNAVESQDWDIAAEAAINLAFLTSTRGMLSEAAKIAEKAVIYAEKSNVDHWKMCSYVQFAYAKHQKGEFDKALKLFEQSEAIDAKLRSIDIGGRIGNLYLYCDLLLSIDHIDRAFQIALQSSQLIISEPSSAPVAMAFASLSRSRALAALGKHDEAIRPLGGAIEELRRAGTLDHLPFGLLASGALFHEVQEHEKSRRDLDEVMRLATRCGMRLHECDAHLEYARLAVAEGKHDDAVVHFKSAEQLVAACGYHRRDPEIAELKAALNQ